MKKNGLLIFAALLFVLALTVPSLAWQGRMAGAGDAGGLIEDESDYLIHPAAIASGKGLNFYGNYRLTYDKATRLDYTLKLPAIPDVFAYSADGKTVKNELQVGTAFNAGVGRMGIFLEYAVARGAYDGMENYNFGALYDRAFIDLKDNLDNLAVRLIYGLPVNGVKLGGELRVAYRSEEQEASFTNFGMKNYPWAAENLPDLNLYPYGIPYKSRYWEALGKASIEGKLGQSRYAFTLKGGLPFASSNEYEYTGGPATKANAEGNVKGFHVGGDLWIRVPVSGRVELPFVVSAGYEDKKRDGSGTTSWLSWTNYENENKNVFVKIGGGADYMPAKGTKVAAGLYYDFVSAKKNISFIDVITPAAVYVDNYTDMPEYTEHRLTLKALAEKELSSVVDLRCGVDVFYGSVKSDYRYAAAFNGLPFIPLNVATSGSNAGVNASVGATFKLDGVILEPFVNAGYVKYETSGRGTFSPFPADLEFNKTNWIIGGGLSVKL